MRREGDPVGSDPLGGLQHRQEHEGDREAVLDTEDAGEGVAQRVRCGGAAPAQRQTGMQRRSAHARAVPAIGCGDRVGQMCCDERQRVAGVLVGLGTVVVVPDAFDGMCGGVQPGCCSEPGAHRCGQTGIDYGAVRVKRGSFDADFPAVLGPDRGPFGDFAARAGGRGNGPQLARAAKRHLAGDETIEVAGMCLG